MDLSSYCYINIYILAIFILPYKIKSIPLLLLGFLYGIVMDFADYTTGIHAASATLVAYIRPRLLLLTSPKDDIEEVHGVQNTMPFAWFLKYTFLSTLVYNIALILLEAFTFNDFLLSGIRIILSTFISVLFMVLYYFIALKKVQ